MPARARFGSPEIKIGSFPGDGGTQRLPRLVGKSFAMQMVLTGAMVDAGLDERKGLVSEVVADEALIPRAFEIAAEIAAMSSAITPYAKRAVKAAFELPLEHGHGGPLCVSDQVGPHPVTRAFVKAVQQ